MMGQNPAMAARVAGVNFSLELDGDSCVGAGESHLTQEESCLEEFKN